MKIARLVRCAVAVGAAVVAGGSTMMWASATVGGGPQATPILGSGSDTTQFMMGDADNLYRFSDGCAQIPTPPIVPPTPTTPWFDFSCQAPDPVSVSRTGTSTLGSEVVTMSDTSNLIRGDQVSGPGVQPGSYVGDIVANTNFAMSTSTWQSNPAPAGAGAGTGTFTFSHIRVTENYAHDQPTEAYFLGSSNGIKQLCNQGQLNVSHIDFARSSRGPKSTDCVGLRFVAYARDGISWEAFNIVGSGVATQNNTTAPCVSGICLTQNQLKGIFVNCTITNWNQVGSTTNLPISIYTPQAGSGTRSTFDGFLGGSSDSCIPSAQRSTHIIDENSNVGIPPSDQAGAIFPFSFGVWSNQVNGSGGAVLGAIDGVAVNSTTIGDGTFPYGRYLYNVYCSSSCPTAAVSSAATVKYVGETGWICKLGSDHSINPITHRNYHTDLYFVYTTNGFVPVPGGAIGGGVSGADYCRLFTT